MIGSLCKKLTPIPPQVWQKSAVSTPGEGELVCATGGSAEGRCCQKTRVWRGIQIVSCPPILTVRTYKPEARLCCTSAGGAVILLGNLGSQREIFKDHVKRKTERALLDMIILMHQKSMVHEPGYFTPNPGMKLRGDVTPWLTQGK